MSDRQGCGLGRARAALAALCLLGLAALQIPALTTGFTVSGDDVEGLGKALEGFWPAALWGIEIAERDGRLGALTIFPLNALGSWLAGNDVARFFMALAHIGVAALFGLWLARAWWPRESAMAAGALAFVAWCALHPVGVPHLPPHAFPMQLAPVFLLIMALHLAMSGLRGQGGRGVAAAGGLFLCLALNEYALLFGAAIIGAGWLRRFVAGAGGIGARIGEVWQARATRLEAIALVLALLPLAAYRLWSGGAYEGVSGDGLAYPDRMALAALGHVAASTALPEFRAGLLDVSWQGALSAAVRGVLTAGAVFLLLPLLRVNRLGAALAAVFACAALALFTLPVVSSVKQQRWCLENADCAYLDARMAILPLAALTVLALAALPKGRWLRGAAAGLVGVVAAGTGLENAWEVEHRLAPLTRPWERAKALACFPERWPEEAVELRHAVDPWGHVASHTYVDVDGIWRRYLASFDPEEDCAAGRAALAARLPAILPMLPVGGADEIGRGEGTGGRFLGAGWHRVEPWGVWSAEREATLVVEPTGAPETGDVLLRLDWVAPPFPDGGPRPVEIAVPGGVLWQGTGVRAEGGCCTARLPLPYPLPPRVIVTISAPEQHNVAPPGGEKRVGIGLQRIALESVE
ncbi:MAG: hypothetical protein AAFR44_00845, partial [Pseudomonadota bacterium]